MDFGDTLDRFAILRKLGSGGMGDVYLGFDRSTDELVALKVLLADLAGDSTYLGRFQREGQVLAQLDHPGIVRRVGAGHSAGFWFLALEFLRGRTLADHLQKRIRLLPETAVIVVRNIAEALGHAHSRNVVHRDVKPENILILDDAWRLKILDFGVAQAADENFKSVVGQIVGTLNYAAPEQLRAKRVDARADLYSLGLMFHELLTGTNPIRGRTPEVILAQQAAHDYPQPSQAGTGLSSAYDAPIMRLLRFDPEERFPTAEALLHDLELIERRARNSAKHSTSIYDFPEFMGRFREAGAAFEHGEHDAALSVAQELSKKTPRAPEVFFLLGRIQIARGYAYNGIQELVKATAFDPTNAHYQLHLGDAYRGLSMNAQARNSYQEALSLDPTSHMARAGLEALTRSGPGIDEPRLPSHGGSAQKGTGGSAAGMPGSFLLGNVPAPVIEEDGPHRKFLDERLPSPPGGFVIFVGTLLWWGWGPWLLGGRAKMTGQIVTQFVGMAAIGLFWPLLYVLASWKLPVELRAVASAEATALTGLVYALTSIVQAVAALRDSRRAKLTGYVIGTTACAEWVAINVGSDRGVGTTEIFCIFRETPRGSGQAALLGRLVVKVVGARTCRGPFIAEGREMPMTGDWAVSVQALRSKIVDPRDIHSDRFPPPLPVEVSSQPAKEAQVR